MMTSSSRVWKMKWILGKLFIVVSSLVSGVNRAVDHDIRSLVVCMAALMSERKQSLFKKANITCKFFSRILLKKTNTK